MMFWVMAVLLVLIGLAGLLLPLRRVDADAAVAGDQREQNIQIARERLAELEQQQAAGAIDAVEFESAKAELEQSLLDDVGQDAPTKTAGFGSVRASVVMLGLFVPVAAGALYFWLGTPQAISMPAPAKAGMSAGHPPMNGQAQQLPDIGTMVGRLEQKLKENPDNPQGWTMLGRSYMVMGRYAEAVQAYTKARELLPEDQDVLRALVNATAMAQGQGGQQQGQASSEQAQGQSAPAVAPPNIGKMVESLHQKLQENPDNPDGWLMLGRSYMNLKQYPEAAAAYEQAYQYRPDSVPAMLGLADTLAMVAGGKVTDKSAALVEKVLAIEPDNATALWMGGLAAQEAGNQKKARDFYRRLLPLVENDPRSKAKVQELLQQTTP